MSKEHGYRVTVEWEHRSHGPQSWSVRQVSTSIRRAINAGLSVFFTEKNQESKRSGRRHHLDAFRRLSVRATRELQKP